MPLSMLVAHFLARNVSVMQCVSFVARNWRKISFKKLGLKFQKA